MSVHEHKAHVNTRYNSTTFCNIPVNLLNKMQQKFIRNCLLGGVATSLTFGIGNIAQAATLGFADVILEYFDSGAGPLPGPYGVDNSGAFPVPIDSPDIILGSDTLGALSLPTGSFVTVGFTDETVIDGPGNDIFIPEIGAEGEQAEVFVSSNAVDFFPIGIGNGGTTSVFDLSSINFTEAVEAIRIVGLDNGGNSPGFDVVNVEVLPESIGDAPVEPDPTPEPPVVVDPDPVDPPVVVDPNPVTPPTTPVTPTTPPAVATTPEPMSVLGLLAFGGLGLISRRKKNG